MEFWDDYEHPDANLTYLPESINHDGSRDAEISGCDCSGSCTDATKCECLRRSGTRYGFAEIADAASYAIRTADARKPSYECNRNCTCDEAGCGNRLIQFGPRKGLEIVNCNEKGLGVRTNLLIKSDSFVCEYVGVVVTEKEATNRVKLYESTVKMNYVFCINERFGENVVKTFVDPTFEGNIGRYINHSCAPNCKVLPVRVNDTVPRLCIFSCTDIQPGQEVTFSYGNSSETVESPRTECLCASENCRKFLPKDLAVLNV